MLHNFFLFLSFCYLIYKHYLPNVQEMALRNMVVKSSE